MNYYNYNELIDKSYNELYEIIESENLMYKFSSLYDYSLDRKELINIILKYRSNYENKYIFYEEDILKLQEYIDKYLILEDTNYININGNIEIIENIDLYNGVNITVLENENISNLAFITNSRGYIYAICHLEYIEQKENMVKYNLKIERNLNRIDFNIDYTKSDEIFYIYFMPKNFSIENNEKFIAKRKLVENIEIKKSKKNKKREYMYFENGYIYTNKYIFRDNFYTFLHKNTNLLCFENSLEFKKNFKFRYTNNFYSMESLKNNEEFSLYKDSRSEKLKINNKDILKKLKEMLIRYINSNNKEITEEIYLVSEVNEKIKGLEISKYNSLFYINYHFINQTINNMKEKIYVEKPYLIFNIENSNFSISENSFKIEEKRNRYNIELNTKLLIHGNILTNNEIKENLKKYLKTNIEKNMEIKESKFNILNFKINSPVFFEYNKFNIKHKYNEELIDYVVNIIYDEIVVNNKNIYKLEDILKDKFLKKSQISDVILDIKGINNMVYDVTYKEISKYFNKINLLDLLKKYNKIKVNGKLTHNLSFISAIKEYIPGKMIENIKIKDDIFSYIFEEYENSLIQGKIEIKYNYLPLIEEIRIMYKSYRNEYIEIYSNKKDKYGKFDVYSKTKEIDLKIVNIDKKETREFKIYNILNKIEMDEKEILDKLEKDYDLNIEQVELLDDIKEDILRILITNNKYILIERKNSQTYIFENSY